MSGATPDRRKQPRLRITLRVRVQGHSVSGAQWTEVTRCGDTSLMGCSLLLEHTVLAGQVLWISMPLPAGLRRYDLLNPNYDTYAIVQSTQLCGAAIRVGVRFLGKTPPRGYEETPGACFLTERRKSPREQRCLQVRLKGEGRAHETTLIENLGAGGARILTAQNLAIGDLVTIEEAEGPFRARCEVRGIHLGKDGIRRLSVRFVGLAASARAEAGAPVPEGASRR